MISQTAQNFHIKNVYSKDWPIRDALKLRLKYTSDWEKKKVLRKTANNFKKVHFNLKTNDTILTV